ncbi:MAG: YggS family pyridoxal phosphate enzyme [Herpetosiphonaceae bacterium]|nr:MAG: YggS family pyridoxal phosphate enzyme [Herpetosiphonaceae bacterium]
MLCSMDESRRIALNLEAVHARIAAAARRAGRSAEAITVVAVSKTHPPSLIAAALAAGQQHFGENRVQEAEQKIEALIDKRQDLRWHLIGHLQRNKVRRAAQLFDTIHSIDSLRLAQALDRVLGEAAVDGLRLPVLLQVNVSGEESKYGFALPGGLANHQALPAFLAEVEQIVSLQHVRVEGLMTIAPFVDDAAIIRDAFRSLRLLRDELARRFPGDWHHLSMGMSGDFELAIEEGATIVRIGTAIFGERTPGA